MVHEVLYPYYAFLLWYLEHSRDIILIVHGVSISCTTPTCFSTLYRCAMVQTWGQVHEYLYLSTLKYRFESTCTLLKYFLNFPVYLYLYSSTLLST